MRPLMVRLALILAFGLVGLCAVAPVLAEDGPINVTVDRAEGIPFVTAPVGEPQEAPPSSPGPSLRYGFTGNDSSGGSGPHNDWELWLAIGILATGGAAGALSLRGKGNWDVRPRVPSIQPAPPQLARGGITPIPTRNSRTVPTDAPYDQERDRFAGQVLKPAPPKPAYWAMLTPEEQVKVESFSTDYLGASTMATECKLSVRNDYGLCLAALDALNINNVWGEADNWGVPDTLFPMYREGERGKWAQYVFSVQAQNEAQAKFITDMMMLGGGIAMGMPTGAPTDGPIVPEGEFGGLNLKASSKSPVPEVSGAARASTPTWTAPTPGSLGNVEARQWYLGMEARIPQMIDANATLEQQARQAFTLRNEFRTAAREAMSDRALAAQLYQTDPNMTWEQVVQKYTAKGFSSDSLFTAIIKAAQRSRQSVNQSLGLAKPE